MVLSIADPDIPRPNIEQTPMENRALQVVVVEALPLLSARGTLVALRHLSLNRVVVATNTSVGAIAGPLPERSCVHED